MSERTIFLAAIDIADPAERAAYLNQACGGDADLRAQVDALLSSHQRSSQFLETPAAAGNSAAEMTLVGHSTDDEDDDRKSAAISGEAEVKRYLQPATRPGWLGRLAHYEVEQILGRGAFGIVVKAFDEKLHRVVAIKLMNPDLAATSAPRKRFLREARTAAAVRHENIVGIYAVEEEPLPYLVMEYIPGITLQQRLDQNGPLDLPEILKIGQQVAAGLAAAHAANVIHRDIKPSNILLEGGIENRAKISDFGLARAVDDASMTSSGLIAGTPMYMAPEQARGEVLDHRADLFSLGSVLYQMTSGRPPFRAPNTVAVLKRVCEDTPRPIQDVIADTPDWLCTIISRLLEKAPASRFQTAKEVADLFARCQAELHLSGKVTCVQSSHHAPRDEPSTAATSSPNRPSPNQPTSQRAVVQPSAVPKVSSRRSETATLKRPLLLVGSILAIVAIIAVVVDRTRDPASGGRQPSGIPTEISDLKSQISNPASEATPDAPPMDAPPIVATTPSAPASDFAAERQTAEWVLANNGSMEIESSEGWSSYKPGTPLPGEWLVIRTIDLREGQVKSSADVDRLMRCQYLETVVLSGPQIDGNAAKWISRWPRMYDLNIIEAPIQTSSLKELRQAGSLHTLKVLGTAVDDRLEFVRHLPTLRTLHIWEPVSLDLALLAEAPQLRTVILRTTQAVDMDKLAVVQSQHGQLRIMVGANGQFRAVGNDPVHQAAKHLIDRGIECYGDHSVLSSEKRLLTIADLDDELTWWIEVRKVPATVQLNAVDSEMLMRVEMHHFTAEGQHEADELALTLSQKHGLASVTLQDCDLTDVGLAHLQQLAGLRGLTLLKSNVTPAGIERFRRAVPGAWVTVGDQVYKPDYRVHAEREAQLIPPMTTGWHGWSADAPSPAIAPFNAEQAQHHQEAWAKYLGVPVEYTNSLGMKFRLIPPGEFLMGSTKEEIDDALKVMTEDWHDCIKSEAPQHKVILTQPRYLGIHEVTQAQYEKVMGENPSHFAPTGEEKEAVAGMNASRHPVETVDWNDAAEFCAKLSETETPMSDSSYQLPTEAEWEFACRAGTTTRFSVGEQDADLLRVGWFDGNSGGRTHAVGELSRNPFGIFDMNGNVWEWTQDWWGPTYYAQFQEESALDPRGASPTVVDRVIRGGHCNDPAPYCRSSFRVRYAPTTRGRNLGFRVSLSVDAVRQTLQLTGPPIPKGMATTPTAPADPDRRAAEYVLSIGGSVMVSQGGQGCWPKTVGDLPEEAFELVVVRAGGIQKVSDAALACFKDCKNLTELVLNYTPVSDAGLAHFKDCKQLAILELHGIRAGDAGLAHFKDCKQLTTLGLADTQATDAGLIHFRDCENLRVLHLRGPEVTDAGLAHFRNCKKLATLTLNANPKVSDAALAYFANLPKLTSVDVQNTKITEAGVKKLSAALPGCKIEWDGGVIELKSPIEAARTAVATLLKKGFRVHLGNIATGELRELKSAVDLNGLGRLYIHSPVKSEQNLYTDPVVLEALRSIPATFTGSQIQVNYPLTGDELGVLVEIPVMRSVGDLYLENTALKDADLKPLAKLANLTGLYFDGSELSDAGLKTLAEIPNLKSLDAGPCKVTSAGLAALRKKTIITLVFQNVIGIDDTAVEHLSAMPTLKYVYLKGTRITADGVKKLAAALPGCKIEWDGGVIEPTVSADRKAAEWVLSIVGTIRIKENGQERRFGSADELPKGPFQLTGVELNLNPKVSDTLLANLEYCKNLTVLDLNYTKVSDVGLAYFKDCKNFTVLHLAGTQVSDAELARFQDCKNLTHLDLNSTTVSDEGLAHFQNCPNLTNLGLSQTLVSNAGLAHLKACKNLTGIDLNSTKVSDAGLAALFKSCPNLSALALNNTQVSDEGLAHCKVCKNLWVLELAGTQVTDVGFAELTGCPKLGSLIVKNTKVSEAGVKKLSAALPGCKIEWDGGVIEP